MAVENCELSQDSMVCLPVCLPERIGYILIYIYIFVLGWVGLFDHSHLPDSGFIQHQDLLALGTGEPSHIRRISPRLLGIDIVHYPSWTLFQFGDFGIRLEGLCRGWLRRPYISPVARTKWSGQQIGPCGDVGPRPGDINTSAD